MICTKAYSELLSMLYGAPLDDAQWQLFLTRLCESTHSTIAMFLRNDSTLGNRMLASGGVPVPDATDRTYQANHSYTDPFREAFMRNPRVGVIEGHDLVPHDQWIKSDVYRAVAAPFGVEHMTCMVLSISTRAHDLISLWRGPERPRLEQEYKELLILLLPHLQNALKIRQTLGHAEDRASNAEAVLNTSATASILLDSAGRVLHMNESARHLTLLSDGLCVRAGRIQPTDRSRRAEFGALITASAASDLGHPGGALALNRSASPRPLQLLVTPVRLTETPGSPVRVLILATDPDHAVDFPDAVLRQIYGFTPAETEIANALMTGFSLDEIARLRSVSVATIRSQMKNLLGKTDTQRQGDLIRLLSTLPRAVPGPSRSVAN
jgi:DNA-binding CsgD family transcriptional regulator/PAS domain-containing protein